MKSLTQKTFYLFGLLIIIFLSNPVLVKAATSLPPGCQQTGSGNNISFSCNTGLGIPITASTQDFTKGLFGIILSISGGIALLLIIVSGYRLMASGGNPEKVQGAKEQLTSAIVGLLFVIFSFVILQLIGVNIIHIPGFGS